MSFATETSLRCHESAPGINFFEREGFHAHGQKRALIGRLTKEGETYQLGTDMKQQSTIWKNTGARSLEKALDLLYAFEPHSPEQSLSQISRRLQLPPSTARRLLKVMVSRGLIEQDPISRLYRLGLAILFLASIAQESLDVRRIALPVMEKLRDMAGENTALNELRQGMRVCIERVESKEVVRDEIFIGDQFPAHCGASGKVLLAYLNEEELRKYLQSRPLRALTPRTITDPKKVIRELDKIRRKGFAFSSGELFMDSLCAISAPIFDREGRVHYSLTITLTPFRLHLKSRERLIRLVKESAAEISSKLGNAPLTKYSPSSAQKEKKKNVSG